MLALCLLLQVALPSDTLTFLTVRDGARSTRLPVERVGGASLINATRLAASLGGSVRRAAPDRYLVSVSGVTFEITPGTPIVRVSGNIAQLPTPPRVRSDTLHVPIAFVSDVLPRYADTPRVAYAPARVELRTLGSAPAAAQNSAAVVRHAPARAKPLVVIDPGHGGPDRGMRGPLRSRWKIQEATLTLQIGRRLRDVLRQRGVDVIMTRDRDTLIALADRGRIANERKADLFVSLHVNAANPRWRNPGSTRGFETYFLSEARTEDARRVEELENSSVQYEVDSAAVGDDALSFILQDMKQNESLRESQLLADAIQSGVATIHPGPSRGVKQAGFRVLVAALVPAVLVEVGFGTNIAEARYLASVNGQRALAAAIAKATLGYLEGYDRRRAQGDTTH